MSCCWRDACCCATVAKRLRAVSGYGEMELPVARRGKDERVSYWGCGDSFPRGGVGDEKVMPMVEVV